MAQETNLVATPLHSHSLNTKSPIDVLDVTPQPDTSNYITFSRAIANQVRVLHCRSFLYEQRIVLLQHSGAGSADPYAQVDALAKEVHRWAVLLDSPLVRGLPTSSPAQGPDQPPPQPAGAPQPSPTMRVASYADGRPSVDPVALRHACAAAIAGGCEHLWLDALCIMHEDLDDVQWQTRHVLPAMVRHRACALSLVLPEGLARIAELDTETRWLADVRHLLQVFAPPRGAAVKVVHAPPLGMPSLSERGVDSRGFDSQMFWTPAEVGVAGKEVSEPTVDTVRWPLVCLESGAAAMTDIEAVLSGSLKGLHLWRREISGGGSVSLVKLTKDAVYPCTFGRVRPRRRLSWTVLESRRFFFNSVLTAVTELDSSPPYSQREAAIWRCAMSTPLQPGSFLVHVQTLTSLLYDFLRPKEAARVATQVRERISKVERRGCGDAMFLDVLAFLLKLIAGSGSHRASAFLLSMHGKLSIPDHCIPPSDPEDGRVDYDLGPDGKPRYSAYVSPTSQLEITGRALPVQPIVSYQDPQIVQPKAASASKRPRKDSSRVQESLVLLAGDDGTTWSRVGDGKTRSLERVRYCAVVVGHYYCRQARRRYTRVLVLRRVEDLNKGRSKTTRRAEVRSRWVVHEWASAPRDLLEEDLRIYARIREYHESIRTHLCLVLMMYW
ncbi:hypothetical protein C8Q80DRAFT_1202078 [Daedaleopsis nitida]|nr:hypothetical protein C8Q80DRAFT_1202078 [Daedaleopsis nitida]